MFTFIVILLYGIDICMKDMNRAIAKKKAKDTMEDELDLEGDNIRRVYTCLEY